MNVRDDYLPSDREQANPYAHETQNQNGNVHRKIFELARPKTPEEIVEEFTRSTMPQLRRACSKDKRLKRHVGAKWLFAQLSDDSFMNCFGGNGRGKIWTSLKELRRRYGHDEETLSQWAKKLEEAGWIWIQRSWPLWCFAISGVTAQPELFVPEFARVRARASNDPNKTVSDGFVQKNDETVKNGANNRESPVTKPSVTVSETVTHGQRNRHSRFHQPSLTPPFGGESRSDQPSVTVGPTVSDGQTNRQSPVGPTVAHGAGKESPLGKGRRELTEGDPHQEIGVSGENSQEAEFQKWKLSLNGRFPSKLETLLERLTVQHGKTPPGPARNFLRRKIHVVQEILDGPLPSWEKPAPAPKPARKAEIARDPTSEEILEGAKYLVAAGKADKLTAAQRAALGK
jgi:hypothetical protein